jgi:hypothetical protein
MSRNKCREDKVMFLHRNSGHNQNIRRANESFESVAKFRYIGMRIKNESDIYDEIKSRLHSRNACHHSVHNILSSRLI